MKTTATATSVNILRTLNTLGKKFSTKKYNEKLLFQLEAELQVVSVYLSISQREAVIFSTIFWLNCNEHAGIDVKDISRCLQYDLIDVLSYQSEVELLAKKKILNKKRNSNSLSMKIMKYDYSVNPLVMDAIINNEVTPELAVVEQMDIYQFVEAVSDLIKNRKNEDLFTTELFEMVKEIENENQHLPMVAHTLKSKLTIEDRTLWYEMCYDLIHSGKSGLDCTFRDIYDRVFHLLQKSRELIAKKN